MKTKKVKKTKNRVYNTEKRPNTSLSSHAELLQSRAELLGGSQRILMELLLNTRCSKKDLACLVGVSPQALSRKIHKLIHSLTGHNITAVRHVQNLGAVEITIARRYFILGQSRKTIAIITGLSLYKVNKIIDWIQSIEDIKGPHNNAENQNNGSRYAG